MKLKSLIFIILLLVGCQTQTEHLGCPGEDIKEEGCVLAQEGMKNLDLFSQLDSVDVISNQVVYSENISGFLALPHQNNSYPGIIMIHEWWGLNDNIKDMAKLVANEGYVVLAVDLYGEVANDSDNARRLSSGVRENPDKAIKNMKKGINYLRELGVTNFGSLGWCFGGQQSLQLSLNEKLDATVIYYGHLESDKEILKTLSSPILGIFGEEDTGIPVESVMEFEKSLKSLGIKNSINIYPNVGHAFANPSGSRYAPEETLDAWNKTLDFLNTNLKTQ